MDGKTVTYIGSGFGQLKTGLSSIESQCRGLNQLTQQESKGVLREVMIWGWQYYFQR